MLSLVGKLYAIQQYFKLNILEFVWNEHNKFQIWTNMQKITVNYKILIYFCMILTVLEVALVIIIGERLEKYLFLISL